MCLIKIMVKVYVLKYIYIYNIYETQLKKYVKIIL